MPPKKPRSKKSEGHDSKSSGTRSGGKGPRKVVFPNVSADGEKLPAPIAALLSVIHPARSATAADTSAPSALSSSTSLLEVEVETKQGYVLKGLLVELDALYNVTLQDATQRRARACDIERALMRDRIEQAARGFNDPFFPGHGSASPVFDEATEALLEEYRERPDSAARPRYVGTTMVRSNNLVMLRFLTSGVPTTTTSPDTATATADKSQQGSKAATHALPLAQRFSAMSAGVKKALALQKLQNRRERRQRLEEAKKKRDTS